MTARALVKDDFLANGVAIALSPREHQVIHFNAVSMVDTEPHVALPDEAHLRLDRDTARALYESLADHFGHAGHDSRALRRDYEAERGRVDRLIDAVIGRQP